jgi:HEAT repeat protein
VKVVASGEASADERRRAREALEEYGFVAAHCASMLLATDPFERSSAAKALGEIGSPAALPFLLEGLSDSESIVRNQSVVSLGELKAPSAIGALLDMARKHPDVPSSLVAQALSACSVDGIDFLDEMGSRRALLSSSSEEPVEELLQLEWSSSINDLPETTAANTFAEALAALESSNNDERGQAVKNLANFPLQKSVAALSDVARHDAEPAIRAAAIASLAAIDHESVFPAMLMGMADDSREVRAAAARSLSHLSFDRSAGYARVVHTADERLLSEVADACLRAGIVSQNLDRLASSDRRQTHEAFTLFCLLAKAGKTHPVLDAIESHENLEVRINAVKLLTATGQDGIAEQLQKLAVNQNQAEEVRTALLDAMYKLEQANRKVEDPLAEFIEQVPEDYQELDPRIEEAKTAPIFELNSQADNFEL